MLAITRGALSCARRRRLPRGLSGLALCGLLTYACGGPQKGADEGGECFRDADCREGFVCIEGACSNDLESLVSMVEGPSGEGAGAMGNTATSTDAAPMTASSVVSGAGGSTMGTDASNGAGGSTTGADTVGAGGGSTMAATVDGGAGGSGTSMTSNDSTTATTSAGGSPASTLDTATATMSTTTQGVSGAGGAP